MVVGMTRGKEPVDELIERQIKEPEEVAKDRLDRILKHLDLKSADRVLVGGIGGDFAVYYAELTWYEACFELTDKVLQGVLKFARDIPQDLPIWPAPYILEGYALAIAFADFPDFSNLIRFLWGPVHDVLKDKWSRWPGRELDVHYHPQFIGGEFMKPEEYKHFIENPVEFMNQVILPRVSPVLADAKPGSAKWNGVMVRVGMAMQKVVNFLIREVQGVARYGYPSISLFATNAYTPADVIGDFLRHPTGAMLDMRRHPDDFKAATEALVEPILKIATAVPPSPPVTMYFIPLHLNEMLPPKMYNEFYWPALKKIIVELYNKGYKGFVFFEGDHYPHVDTILELPKGWGIGWFERPRDFLKVWEKLKGHTVVMGGIPVSLMVSGTPEKIEEHVKKIIDAVKPEGGFILAPAAELPRGTPVENVRALINAVEKYGRY